MKGDVKLHVKSEMPHTVLLYVGGFHLLSSKNIIQRFLSLRNGILGYEALHVDVARAPAAGGP